MRTFLKISDESVSEKMKLASILEDLPDGVIIVNRNKCVYFNKEASIMIKEKEQS